MTESAYVNGTYLPISEARLSIDDRGFQFGDGVYEVLYGLDGRPFLLREHMDRLKRSLEGLRIRGVDLAEVEKVILVLAAKVRPRSKVYVSITRGTAPRNHTFPVGAKPNIVATVREAPVAPETYLRDGIKAVCVPDRRWGRCDLKTLNLLGNVLARQEAEEAGAQEAILYGPDEIVREGSSANVFAVIEGVICTHPLDERILPGVTRGLLIDLARREKIEVREEGVALADFRKATEVFLTGTVAELVAVTTLDNRPIGTGKPGEITRRLRAAYDEYVRSFRSQH